MNYRMLMGLAVMSTLLACEREPRPGTRLGDPESPGTPPPAAPATVPAADEQVEIEIVNTQGQRIGTARLSETGQGVQIAIQASNLPAGERGFHLHQTGRCDPPDFQSAGAHFAPQGRQHGLENPQGPHAGDLPNLPVRPDGTADTTVVTPRVTLREGQENSLLREGGTALVIHQDRDDQRTDPSGNSGDRIACGVVGRS